VFSNLYFIKKVYRMDGKIKWICICYGPHNAMLGVACNTTQYKIIMVYSIDLYNVYVHIYKLSVDRWVRWTDGWTVGWMDR